jgi:uncharacterized membrane protein YGL010W
MASPFRPALQLLGQYAEFHRDRRNIATHFVGVPMIMFGSLVLLSRPAFELGGLALSPAWLVLAALAHAVPGGAWWAWGLGAFVLGWVIQFVGHYYEGRKPAFVDDLVGLFVAPMFVLLELLALAGFFKGLMAEVERQAGPTLLRDLAHPATR